MCQLGPFSLVQSCILFSKHAGISKGRDKSFTIVSLHNSDPCGSGVMILLSLLASICLYFSVVVVCWPYVGTLGCHNSYHAATYIPDCAKFITVLPCQ